MCLLTFLPAGVMPDLDALRNGALVNNDGHGFAIIHQRQIIVERGLDAEVVLKSFAALRRRYPDGPALFHSRYATHGSHDLANCHPFPVGGDPRTMLAHNGILPRIVQPGKRDSRSDTRITAEDFLPAFGSLRLRRIRLRFERWMGPANRMVILTVDPRFRRRAFILNEPSGIWDAGAWYSNNGYQPEPQIQYTFLGQPPGRPGHDQPTPDPDVCPYCSAIPGPQADGCRWCGWCVYCGKAFEYCRCLTPASVPFGDGWADPDEW